MRESAVVRLIGEELFWYPPGSSADPRPLSDSAETSQLESIAAARRAPMIFAVPGAEVRLQQVEFSSAEKRHISKSLPYLLEDEFASDLESLHLASQPLDKYSLAVAICEHERMLDWAEQVKELPVLGQWVPEPLLLPWQPGELTLVIEENGVIARGGPCTGFTVERELASELIEALDVAGANSVVAYGEDQERDMALVPRSLHDRVQWRSGGFAAALLLAEDSRRRLNLRQGGYGPSLPLQHWWQQWRWPAAAVAAAFAVQVVASYSDYSLLESENLRMRQQILATYREINPRGTVVDPEKQLGRLLAELKGDSRGGSFVGLMDRIGRVVQSHPDAQLTSVNFSSRLGDVRIQLLVPDFAAVESIRTQLSKAGLEAELENSNAQGQQVRARLKVGEGRG
ncbi:MAG: type II secretion system protein GspL [Gammaproteobacteria bacterium]|nr:type II secretion system protein GspL [Gammaproteobacteria bacterium]